MSKLVNYFTTLNFFHFLLVILLIKKTNELCIPGKNCPINQGVCNNNECICLSNYWTFVQESEKNTYYKNPDFIYCNYEKISRWIPFLLDIFLPPIGTFYLGRRVHGMIKLTFLVAPFLMMVFGFFMSYPFLLRENRNQNIYNSREHNVYEEENRNIVYRNNNQEGNQGNSVSLKDIFSWSLPLILSVLSGIAFVLMYIIDIICYLFAFYNDGNGVPLL